MTGQAAASLRAGQAAHSIQEIVIERVAFVADVAGALFHEGARLLVVADLHFEKGSYYAERRVHLPPYDTAATLARLAALILRYRPMAVVALGDSFHDRRGPQRLGGADREALAAMQVGRDWIWIAGNHDPDPPRDCGGEARPELSFQGLVLRHEPLAGARGGEIAGHLHPIARVTSPSGTTRRRCFVADPARCILPAFGAYAGGLNLWDEAFGPLFPASAVTAHVLGRERVYPVSRSRCLAD